MLKFIIFILVCFFIAGPLSYFITDLSLSYNLGFTWLEDHRHLLFNIHRGYLLVTFLSGCLLFSAGFIADGILKYKPSEISGILGILLSFLTLGLLLFFPDMIWLLMLASILNLYSFSTPIVNLIIERATGNRWEKIIILSITSFVFVFYTGYESNILINELFAVDARHFTFTKIIAIAIIVSPYLLVASIILFICNLYKILDERPDNSSNLFLSINGFLASFCLVIFSTIFVFHGRSVIKNVASTVDFNARSICSNVNNGEGVIYLDDRYELILVDKIDNNQHQYEIRKCEISKS